MSVLSGSPFVGLAYSWQVVDIGRRAILCSLLVLALAFAALSVFSLALAMLAALGFTFAALSVFSLALAMLAALGVLGLALAVLAALGVLGLALAVLAALGVLGLALAVLAALGVLGLALAVLLGLVFAMLAVLLGLVFAMLAVLGLVRDFTCGFMGYKAGNSAAMSVLSHMSLTCSMSVLMHTNSVPDIDPVPDIIAIDLSVGPPTIPPFRHRFPVDIYYDGASIRAY